MTCTLPSLVGLALWLPGVALAASIQVSPNLISVEGAPGTTHVDTLAVGNRGRRALRVSAYAWDATVAEDGALRTSPPGTMERSIVEWISISPTNPTVPALRSAELEVSISIPEDASGGYMGVVYVESVPSTVLPTSEVAARLGVPVLVNVTGTEPPQTEVVQVRSIPPTEGEPLVFELVVQNRGTRHGWTHASSHQNRN